MNVVEPEIIQGAFGTSTKLAFAPLPFSHTASLGILVGAGSFTEDELSMGYSHFLEHMLFKGTKRLDFEALNKEFEKLGAYVNAFTGKYYTLFYVHTLEEFTANCLTLLLEMIFESTLPPQEIEKEKKVILEEISSYKDNPEDYLIEEFYSKTFHGSFFGHPILGTTKIVQNIDQSKLTAYYQKHYSPDNMMISVAGKFSKEAILEQLEQFFSRLSPKDQSSFSPRIQIPFDARSHTYHKADLEQAYVCLGLHTQIPEVSKQTLKLFNTCLGGMVSSRLYLGIRERRALCYGIDSTLYTDPNIGFFNIFASTQANQLPQLLDAIGEEMESLQTNQISEEELTIARNQIKSRIIFRQESVSQTMLRLASQIFFYGKTLSDQKILEKLNQTKIQDFAPLYEHFFLKNMSVHTLLTQSGSF